MGACAAFSPDVSPLQPACCVQDADRNVWWECSFTQIGRLLSSFRVCACLDVLSALSTSPYWRLCCHLAVIETHRL